MTDPATPELPLLLDVRAVAKLVGVCTRTVQNLSKTGKFPKPIMVGRKQRWSSRAIVEWIDRGGDDAVPNPRSHATPTEEAERSPDTGR